MSSPPLSSPEAPMSLLTVFFCLLLFVKPTTSATASPATAASSPSIAPAASPANHSLPAPTASPVPPSTSPSRPSSSSTLDPKQLIALDSLNIPTTRDPCTKQPETATCDAGSPFRHLISLRLANCSADSVALSYTALKSLSTLQSLSFFDCPISPIRFPSDLALNLRSFSAVSSLRHLTGVWLSRLVNVTDLTISDVPVSASGPYVILGNMHNLRSVTVSNANLSGSVPKHWHTNLTHIDFSENLLKGSIPNSITLIDNLQSLNLSLNQLDGEIPTEIGNLIALKNLSLSSNSLSGAIPISMASIPGLVSVDLSSNQLNGTVPRFFTEMRNLKYLNLAKNNFHGVIPFNESFIKKLEVFKIGENSNLCYNHSTLSSKLKLGIAQCDKHGLPMSPPPSKGDSSANDNADTSDYDDSGDSGNKSSHHHGPSKFVLGVAIALSSIVFLIVFLILLSKCCK
ncbi:hypothetical protein SAY87_030503 [Trapa incisa]|uniref:Receptor-like protein 51 n=1 Tax=Trapa incisa TaxID=236973 RepID=A0AAN7KVB9_9MYRT|nr:hypothetical protein SAY87_030503 [Trapa incisa]